MIERAASCEGCVLKGKGVETNQVVRKKKIKAVLSEPLPAGSHADLGRF